MVHFVLCGTLLWYSPHCYWVDSPIGNPCSRSLFPHGCLLIDYLSESESEGEQGKRAGPGERQRETLTERERELTGRNRKQNENEEEEEEFCKVKLGDYVNDKRK